MSRFAEILTQLREEKKMTLSKLAREASISRAYLSLMENRELRPPKLPSVQVLKTLVNILAPDDPAKSYTLIQAALDLYPDKQLHLRGWFDQEPDRQLEENVSEIWVVSNRIAENVNRELYQTTIKNIADDVRYVFFIPLGSQEWNYFKNELVQDIAAEKMTNVMCIEANPLMFFSRIAIINPDLPDVEGTISIGSVEDTQLQNLERKDTDYIIEHLRPIIRSFERNSNNRSLSLPTGSFNLLNP
jgi:transcriptional regulator with XRE-family HTH domain